MITHSHTALGFHSSRAAQIIRCGTANMAVVNHHRQELLHHLPLFAPFFEYHSRISYMKVE